MASLDDSTFRLPLRSELLLYVAYQNALRNRVATAKRLLVLSTDEELNSIQFSRILCGRMDVIAQSDDLYLAILPMFHAAAARAT